LPLESEVPFATRFGAIEHVERPLVLLAATLFWPLSARLATRLIECGCRVAAICPKGHYLRYIEGIDKYASFRSLSALKSFEEAIRELQPELIVPCDDRAVSLLHELHRKHRDLRYLMERSLGNPSGFELIDCRASLLETARSLGIDIPATKQISTEEDLCTWFAEGNSVAVLKRDGTWAGEGVAIVQSAQQAKEAFRRLSRPTALMTACKRLLVNGDPLALWSWSAQSHPSLILQEYIEGQPANSMIACWEGKVLSLVAVEVLASEGATGAAFLVRPIEDERLIRDAEVLAEKLQLTGFYGFDYVIDKSTRVPYLIEVNPRCTQLGHLPLAGGRDLAALFCEKVTGRHFDTQDLSSPPRIVGLYPQATRWSAQCSLSEDVYYDVPQNQPRLLNELTLPVWPERRWIARLYHNLFPSTKPTPVEYDLRSSPEDFPAADGTWSGAPTGTVSNETKDRHPPVCHSC